MQSCRDKQIGVLRRKRHQDSHAGVILSRYLESQQEKEQERDIEQVPAPKQDAKPRDDLLAAARDAVSQGREVYASAFFRWRRYVKSLPVRTIGCFQVKGRLIVGLGSDNVLESGITLHHTYGVPIIPGSALKGLAAHYCEQSLGKSDARWCKGGEYHLAMFGSIEDSGHLTFFDAWPFDQQPTVSNGKSRDHHGLVLDVMTPHHTDYYAGNQGAAPTDFDDPIPVTFLSVAGTFLVAVACDDTSTTGGQWTNAAMALLEQALAEWGVGGKTSSGYGRLMNAGDTNA